MAYGGSISAKSELEKLLRLHPSCKGLAVVIGNQDKPDGQDTLKGVLKDVDKMTRTFGKLKFAVLKCINYPGSALLELFRALTVWTRYPASWRRVVFIFAGHGTENQIYTHDDSIDIPMIIDFFQPDKVPLLGNVPKLFFFDVCRGDNSMKPVVTARGGQEVTKIVPSYGNCLVAFSTTLTFKAYENQEGGVWLGMLAEVLLTVDKSVLDVLTEVNKRLVKKYQDAAQQRFIQQPQLEGTVNEHIHLLKESKEGEALSPSIPMHQASAYLPQHLPSPPSQMPSEGFPQAVPPPFWSRPTTKTPMEVAAIHQQSTGGVAPTQVINVAMHFGTGDVNMSAYGAGHGASPVLQAGKGTSQPMQWSLSAPQPAAVSSSRGSPSCTEQLKEYFLNSSRPQDADKLLYIPREVQHGYQTTVMVPQLGYEKSDVCTTSKKADNDAARKALAKLMATDDLD